MILSSSALSSFKQARDFLMGNAIYQYPEKAYVNRPIPKTKFYENASITKSVKDAFVGQIQQIVWAYKLSPETVNLPATKGLFEIQVFNVLLKTQQLNENVLQAIDKAIPHPIIYQLKFEDKIKIITAYKRINEADETKWVVEQYLSTEWITSDEANEHKKPLPIALNLVGLYEQILKELMPIQAIEGENIKAQTQRLQLIAQKQKEIDQLQRKMHNEKQFNRKVVMNGQLKTLQQQLDALLV
jgi:hypothetical protein